MVQYRVEDGPIKKALDTGRCPYLVPDAAR